MQVNSISFTHSKTLSEQKKQDKNFTQSLTTGEKLYAGLSVAGIIGLTILTIAQSKRITKLKNISKIKAAAENTLTTEPSQEKLLPYKIEDPDNNALYNRFKKANTTFIDFLQNTNENAGSIKTLLFSVTSDRTTATMLIKEIIANPRKTISNLRILKEKIGGEKNLIEWLQGRFGYQEAYDRFITNLEQRKNITVDDLLKISPDWHLHVLKKLTNDNLSFGKLPKEFKELGDYSHFAEWVNSQNCKSHEPLELEFSGKLLEVTRMSEGKSGKTPYLIIFKNNPDKKYILKVQQSWGADTPYTKENLAYRSDSTFTNAQMDYYLTLHKCENSPKFYYYDYKSNSGLYEFIPGKGVQGLRNILEANKLVKDLNRLGIYYNDACGCNFIVQEDGVVKVIDIGDSSFIDPLRPGAKGCNLQTPNWCGVGLPNLSMMLKD